MKPFDLEAARNGAPIVTFDGQDAHFIAYLPDVQPDYQVLIKIKDKVYAFRTDGTRAPLFEVSYDPLTLFMANPKHVFWINFYEGKHVYCYLTQKEADDNASSSCKRIGGRAIKVVIEDDDQWIRVAT